MRSTKSFDLYSRTNARIIIYSQRQTAKVFQLDYSFGLIAGVMNATNYLFKTFLSYWVEVSPNEFVNS